MSRKTRLIALLAVVMLASVLLFSCGNDSGNTPSGADTTAAAGGETTAEISEEEMTDEQKVLKKIEELPKDTYGGEEFRFFVRSTAYHSVWYSREIYVEEEINETLNDAVYRRNRKVEELYDILIAETGNASSNLTSEIRTLILSGDDTHAVFMPSLTSGCMLAGEQLFYSLYDVPNLDLTSPWWDKAVERDMAIGGNLFFTIGDISFIDKEATRGIYFNKKIVEDFQLGDLYQLVKDNEWTVDKMYELAKIVASDSDNDGRRTELDTHGFLYENLSLYTIMNAMGGMVAQLDEDKLPVITFNDTHTQNILTKLFEFMYDKDVCYNPQSMMFKKSGQSSSVGLGDVWYAENTLFWECGFNNLEKMRQMETDFGILPVPKLNSEVENYHASFYIGGPSALCIPITNTDLEKTGTIVEALCAYSSITLMPAYYETCIQGKYTRDVESVDMLDIIFANRVYDLAIINVCGNINQTLSNLNAANSTNVASSFAKVESKVQDALDDLTEAYTK